jgi:hypothetical protein
MRKLAFVTAVLVAVGLTLFFMRRPGGAEASSGMSHGGGAASAQPQARQAVLQSESREGEGARGTADADSTPWLAQAPSEKDGVLEVEVVAGEQPVPGASVRLYWRGPRDPNLNEVSWRLTGTGVTDAQGQARWASGPGSYLVVAQAQGFAPLLRDVVRPYGEARTVVRLKLEPGQRLTGRTVEQGSQDPLPFVELVLTMQSHQMETWQTPEAPVEERVHAVSDARGNFRIENLTRGGYLLEARAPGHAKALVPRLKVPASEPLTVALQAASVIEGFVVDTQGSPAAGAEVQVSGRVPAVTTSGSGGGFSVEVEAGSYTLSARSGSQTGSLDKPVIISAGKTVRDVRIQLGQGSALEGRVVARSTGAPIAAAFVDVRPHSSNGDSGRTVADGSGHFSVEALAPGSYDVVVTAPGFTSLIRPGLTIASGERFSIELQLTGTGAVEGQVRDSAGQPVAGAQVVSSESWLGTFGSEPAEARTDAEGHYRLEGLPVGYQSLTARRERAAVGPRQPVAIREEGTARVDFTLQETGTIEGVVRAASGPLPPLQFIVTASPQDEQDLTVTDFPLVESDSAGSFRMSLPPGQYEVRAIADGRRDLGRASQEVEVEAGKTVRAELILGDTRRRYSLQGVVLEPDGSPSVEAYVGASTEISRGALWTSLVDQQGRFSIPIPHVRDASPGRLIVSASNGGRMGQVQGVRADEREVVVKLRPAASARGRVVRSSGGAPVKGFTLTLQAQQRGPFMVSGRTWEFAGDRFELRDVPALPVRLRVRTADGAGGEAAVSPVSGAVAEVEITVKDLAGVRDRMEGQMLDLGDIELSAP